MKKQVKLAADPITPPARKAELSAPVESPALPSPDVEVLIKKVIEHGGDEVDGVQKAARRGRASQV